MALAAAACGAEAPGEPAPGPKPAPAPKAPDLAPEAAQVLDRMDEAGKALETLTARFDYELNQTLYEDVQKRKGDLAYRRPNQFRFEFTSSPKEAFAFDGRLLYHRQDATKQMHIWETRRPDEPPLETFELGRSPFPMPFGQKKETVLKYFAVARDPKEEAADKKRRAVLVLVPRADAKVAGDYTRIALWIEPATGLPTRMRLWDPSENITTMEFEKIEANAKVDAKTFGRPAVPESWEIVDHAKDK
jgi:outer membrane lipoprotein-sorting protein